MKGIGTLAITAIWLTLLSAEALCAQTGALSPADEEFIANHFEVAKRAELFRNFPVAIREYQAILDKYPRAVPEVYQNLGLVWYLEKNYGEAIRVFERGLKLKPAMAGSRLFLGASYVLTERPALALPHLQAAHKANPTQESAMNLGLALTSLRRYDEANPYFRFALPLASNRDYFLHLLGNNYLKLAEQLGNTLSRSHPESKYEHIMLAKIVDAQQWFQVAAKEYLEAAKLDPMNASLFLPLARWLTVLGLDPAAQLAFDRYRQLLPFERNAALDRSDLPKRELADVGIKVDYAAELRALPPVSIPPAPQLTAEVNAELSKRQDRQWKQAADHFAAARWQEAIQTLSSIRPAPKDWLRDYLLATAWLLRDDALKAEDAARKLIPYTASVAAVHLLRWEIYRQLSFQYFQRLMDEHPASAWTHFAKARNLDAQGKREALDEYQAAIAADPKLPEVRIAFADFQVSNSNLEEALTLCKKELEINPFSTAAKLRIGRIYIGLRQPEKGLPFVEEALKIDPNDPDAHADLARGLELTGETEKAIAGYARALELDPSLNRLHYVLARLYRKAGKPELAEREYKVFQKNEAGAREQLLDRTRKLRETASSAQPQ